MHFKLVRKIEIVNEANSYTEEVRRSVNENFGFEKLTPLFKSLSEFEIDQKESTGGRFKLIYVRNKKK